MRISSFLAVSALSAVAVAIPAYSQPFSLVAQLPINSQAVAPGGTLSLAAPAVGVPLTAKLTFTYRGTPTPDNPNISVDIYNLVVSGSNDFSIDAPALPVTLGTANTVSTFVVNLTYLPRAGTRLTGQLIMRYQETASAPATFVVNLVATAPDVAFSYTLPNANATPMLNGDKVPFPDTLVTTTTPVGFILTNRGTAQAVVNSITYTGSAAFQLAGLTVPPFNIDPGQTLRFSVNFTPLLRQAEAGSISVDYGTGYRFTLQGAGTAPVFTYTLTLAGPASALQPGQTIAFADTSLGNTITATVRVQNTGNADGILSTIAVLGDGLLLNNLPFLPTRLAFGADFVFTLAFAPVKPGPVTGYLRIGDDVFPITANALGPLLNYSYTVGGVVTPVPEGGSVLFTSVKVGQNTTATFTVTNTGNLQATVSGIFIDTTAVFSLTALPAVPVTLPPSGSTSFTITFTPNKSGVLLATLRVGGPTFTVTGSGLAPDPLPAIRLGGFSGTSDPLLQPSYTLSLAQPYSTNLTGTLNLSFNSAVFTNDATVQFATGGRAIGFTIPAGTTQALFANNDTQIRLQVGSVAGTISLTPSFATPTGIDLTPDTVPNISVTVPQLAPQITSLQIVNRANSSFTLYITGYSTGRSVSNIDLDVTPVSGEVLPSSHLSLPVDSAFGAWYQTQQSQQYGSVFTAIVPITLQGISNLPNLIDAIQSVSATLSSPAGKSAASSANFH